jgi:hypothetical protein
MLRSFLSLAVFASLSLSLVFAEEKSKQPAADAKEAKADAVPNWVPKQLLGTHAAKRLAKIQADIDAANAKRGPAREEADKARSLAFKAEQKSDELKRIVLNLEAERTQVLERSMAQAHEDAQQRATFETSQKVSKLEAQLREVTAQLISVKKQKDQSPAGGEAKKDCKHDCKPKDAKATKQSKEGAEEKEKGAKKEVKKEETKAPADDKGGKEKK